MELYPRNVQSSTNRASIGNPEDPWIILLDQPLCLTLDWNSWDDHFHYWIWANYTRTKLSTKKPAKFPTTTGRSRLMKSGPPESAFWRSSLLDCHDVTRLRDRCCLANPPANSLNVDLFLFCLDGFFCWRKSAHNNGSSKKMINLEVWYGLGAAILVHRG